MRLTVLIAALMFIEGEFAKSRPMNIPFAIFCVSKIHMHAWLAKDRYLTSIVKRLTITILLYIFF